MSRTDSASRVIQAERERVFAALVDAVALAAWLPPNGMSGRFKRFDARPGGSYRLVLTYDEGLTGSGKTTSDSDIVEARFVEISAYDRIVQEVDFVSDDLGRQAHPCPTLVASSSRDDMEEIYGDPALASCGP